MRYFYRCTSSYQLYFDMLKGNHSSPISTEISHSTTGKNLLRLHRHSQTFRDLQNLSAPCNHFHTRKNNHRYHFDILPLPSSTYENFARKKSFKTRILRVAIVCSSSTFINVDATRTDLSKAALTLAFVTSRSVVAV